MFSRRRLDESCKIYFPNTKKSTSLVMTSHKIPEKVLSSQYILFDTISKTQTSTYIENLKFYEIYEFSRFLDYRNISVISVPIRVLDRILLLYNLCIEIC